MNPPLTAIIVHINYTIKQANQCTQNLNQKKTTSHMQHKVLCNCKSPTPAAQQATSVAPKIPSNRRTPQSRYTPRHTPKYLKQQNPKESLNHKTVTCVQLKPEVPLTHN
eukprot:gene2921-1903_t